MRDIVYKYDTLGQYITADSTVFGEDKQLKLVALPHDFSIAVGGEVLRHSSFDGGAVVVSQNGEAVFYDNAGSEIARADKTDSTFRQVKLLWKKDALTVEFGCVETVDNYPNCDGEYDRWSERWNAGRTVALRLSDNALIIS